MVYMEANEQTVVIMFLNDSELQLATTSGTSTTLPDTVQRGFMN